MAAFEVIALDTATPQLRAPGAADTYTFPRAVEMPLGTANGVLYLSGSKVVTSGSGLTFDGTNLGVGTISPIAGSGLTIGNDGNSNATVKLAFSTATTERASIELNGGSGELRLVAGYAGYGGFQTFFANGSEQMRLTSTGLGIGTSSPGAKLHIKTGDTTQGLRFENASSIVSAVGFTSTYDFTVDAGAGAGGAFLLLKGGAPGSTGGIKMYTEGAERIHVKYTGQVRFIPLAADPAGAENGDVYYNSSTNKLRLYAGGGWTDIN
jgi:hypothetical protein